MAELRTLIGLSLLAWAAGVASETLPASSAPPAAAEPPAVAASPADMTRPEIEDVLVEAPEPRYVAPTRRDRIGRVWAPVLINGQGPFRLVLDTGASRSAVIASVADRLGIPLPESASIRLHGVTGSAMVSSIKVDSMEVGELTMGSKVLPIVPDVFGGAEGVLGTEALADKRIYIDFDDDRIEIAYSRGQAVPADFSSIPVKLMRGGLLTCELRIGSVRTTAIIDTGAQQTVGNAALRKALIRSEKEGTSRNIIGVTLHVAQGDSLPTPPIAFGDARIRGLRVTFSDMFIFEHWRMTRDPVLLIGMDVLGLLDILVIDYERREIRFRARS